MAECYTNTTVNIAAALGFFSRICSLQSLEMLEYEHHLVTALSVELWPGVLQITQKHIRGWENGLEAEMGFPMSEAHSIASKREVPSGIGDGQPAWKPLSITHGNGGGIQSEDTYRKSLLDTQVHHSHRLLRKILGAVPGEQREHSSEIWGEELLSLEGENTSDFDRQNTIGKPINSTPAMKEIDVTHEKMMEFEPLLEASGERNLRSINLTHGECQCNCVTQTVWYPEHSHLCMIWDVEEVRSIVLPENRQKSTLLVVSSMLALRWIEANVTKCRESKAPTAESKHAISYSRRLELLETACKVFAVPVEVRHGWSRIKFFPWFRATLTSWLYAVTKDHIKKHQKEYRQFQQPRFAQGSKSTFTFAPGSCKSCCEDTGSHSVLGQLVRPPSFHFQLRKMVQLLASPPW